VPSAPNQGHRLPGLAWFALVALLFVTGSATAQDASAVMPSQSPASAPSLDEHLSVPGGLRVADVVRAIVDSSHDRAARVAEVSAARSEVDRASMGFVPRVTLAASYTRLSPIDAPTLGVLAAPADQTQSGLLSPGSPLVAVPFSFPVILDQTQLRAQLAIPVTDYFLRVLPAREAAEHASTAAEAMVVVTEQRLALEAEALYWGWARAELSIVVAQQALALAQAHREDAQRLLLAGLGLASDVARAEAQVAAMQELVGTTSHARDAARDRMRTLMHVAVLPSGIGEALPMGPDAEGDLEALVELALAHRSELRAIDGQIRANDAQHTLVDAAMIPRLDLVGEALLANPNPRFVPQTERFDATWALGAQASWQLSDTLSAEPSRRGLESRIAALRAQRELVREGIRAEVVDAHRAILDARVSMISREAQVHAAQRTLELASAVYRHGRGTSLVVMDAQTLLVRTRLELLAARIDDRIAHARLRRAIEE